MHTKVAVLENEIDHLKTLQAQTFKKLDEISSTWNQAILKIGNLEKIESSILENEARIKTYQNEVEKKIDFLFKYISGGVAFNALAMIGILWKIFSG